MQHLTPKLQFQQSNDNISKHRKLVESPEYQRAVLYARLEYSRVLAESVKDQTSAMVAGIKNQAIEEFLIQMFWLSEVPQVPKVSVIASGLPEEPAKRN